MNARTPGLVLLFFGLAALAGCGRKPARTALPTPTVSVAQPIQRKLADFQDFTGRTDAISTVDIRARVTGYLVKVNFKDGDIVKEGTVLYEIDPRPYQASYEVAKGNLERLQGQKMLVDIQVERYKKLAAKGAASKQELDQYLGQQAENAGSLVAAKGQLDQAKLNLDFCTITAPITGKMIRTYFMPGNLIVADSTLLTTQVSIDPIYGYFSVDEPTLLEVRKKLLAKGVKPEELDKAPVLMGLATDPENQYPYRGTFNFINNVVDPLTGTITVRGLFKNPDGYLLPGLFVRIRLPLGKERERLLISDRAIGSDQGQKYVYVVDAEKKVHYRAIKVGQQVDNLRVIESGLEANEWIIVDGLQRVRPNMEVKTDAVDMVGQPAKPLSDAPPKRRSEDASEKHR